jgi:hypothetical protein
VVSSGKRASLNAGSPTDNKKAGVRVVGVSDALRKAMNIKNRRLRSQEAGQANPGLRSGSGPSQQKPPGGQSTQKMAPIKDKAAKVVGIQSSSKRTNAFLPVLAGKPGSASGAAATRDKDVASEGPGGGPRSEQYGDTPTAPSPLPAPGDQNGSGAASMGRTMG